MSSCPRLWRRRRAGLLPGGRAPARPAGSDEAGVGLWSIEPQRGGEAPIQRVEGCGCGGGASGPLPGHEREGDGLEPLRDLRVDVSRSARLSAQDGGDDLARVLTLERDLARQKLVEHDTERVEVGPRVRGLSDKSFRGEIVDGPAQPRRAPVRLALGEPEVEDLHLERPANQDVVRLDIVVEKIPGVDVVEAAEALDDELVEPIAD